jgi:hypothetical protein
MLGDCTEFMVQGIVIVYDRRHIGGCRIGARFRSLYRPGFGSSPSIVACEFPDMDAQVTIMYTQSVMPAQNFIHLVEEIQTMVALLLNPHIVLTGQFRSGGAHSDCAWIKISAVCQGYQCCNCSRLCRGVWFKTTVGVHQGCLLSPMLFNIN